MDNHHEKLEYLARVLIRCFVLSIGVLVVWFVLYLVVGQWAYEVHSTMFQITRRDFDLINYYGMAFVKLLAVAFFLIPYISIRLVLPKLEQR